MDISIFQHTEPENEPVLSFAPDTVEREQIRKELIQQEKTVIEIPLIIGGKEIRTGRIKKVSVPHNHHQTLAEYHVATSKDIQQAINEALKAKYDWMNLPWTERASVMMKAADLLCHKYRFKFLAATMLGQSKNVYQGEIDAIGETIDFLRFNAYYASVIYAQQPKSTKGHINLLDYRPLEGFVAAISPFNFTAIAANLTTSVALLGNTVVWKPASTALYSNYLFMKILQEAGLPEGVVNFIPSSGTDFSQIIGNHKDLAGIHFTGSTEVFQSLWRLVGENVTRYKSYPKLVGETGGKNFMFVHTSADPHAVVTAIIRGGFEYQGQKCSAVSRVYIPHSQCNSICELLIEQIKTIRVGSVSDFSCFMNAVIDENSFQRIMNYIDRAKNSSDAQILIGGNGDATYGYFIEPTVILTTNPHFVTMKEEIFGPVVTLYAYNDAHFEDALQICDTTSPFGLTGAFFARDRYAIQKAREVLRYSAGNFYINDKPTGAVVGEQPFGGSRASGTNDKAGSYLNLLRWIDPRTIKESFAPPVSYQYPFMEKPNL